MLIDFHLTDKALALLDAYSYQPIPFVVTDEACALLDS